MNDKPLKLTKQDKEDLLDLGAHNVKPFAPEEKPEFVHKKVDGVDKCRICGYPQKGMVVCPMCRNCQYCGGYSQSEHFEICDFCGNEAKYKPKDLRIKIRV